MKDDLKIRDGRGLHRPTVLGVALREAADGYASRLATPTNEHSVPRAFRAQQIQPDLRDHTKSLGFCFSVTGTEVAFPLPLVTGRSPRVLRRHGAGSILGQ